MRLVIAAKVDPADQAYYEHAIAPMIQDCPLVEYVGEVDEQGKDALLGGAYAYLFPIDWPEPFGLTMIESMATGTPVVAYRAGSVPEIILLRKSPVTFARPLGRWSRRCRSCGALTVPTAEPTSSSVSQQLRWRTLTRARTLALWEATALGISAPVSPH
jgi:glycosyltransferase involved in cell wall biosynthesis